MDWLNRVLYVWGLVGLAASLGLYLWMLTCGCWGWAVFDAILIGLNCQTLWLNARTCDMQRQQRLLDRFMLTRRV